MEKPKMYEDLFNNPRKVANDLKFLEECNELLEWKPEELVLDVGSGPGFLTVNMLKSWLPKDFRYILGVDVSAKMVNYAEVNHTSEKVEYKVFDVCGDVSEILKIEKYSGGFDKVFSFYVLNWLEDLQKGMNNLFALMKPGGQGLVVFAVKRSAKRTLQKVRSEPQWREYFKDVNRPLPSFPSTEDPAKEFTEILERAGFQVTKCLTFPNDISFPSLDGIKGFLEMGDLDIDCVPGDLKKQFLDDSMRVMEDLGLKKKGENVVMESLLTCVFKKPLVE